mgnify:FL=1|nr:hypothetical protein [uncultured Prevotella sp.]
MTQGEYEMRVRRQESFLLAQDGQFLGMLSSNKYQSDSVMNEYGSYGSKYSSTSIFNQYGQYGSRYASYSPFNPYTSTPPQIILRGQWVGLLTTNYFLQNRLDPHQLIDWIHDNGL